MVFVPVIKYEVDWKPTTNQYRINIWLNAVGQPLLVPVNTETEFAAVLAMLSKAGVLFETASGVLQLPPRSVGT